ncbi:MAG: hypothetical protein IKP97_03325 [Kiritimatiellae bacterium]|nr:hypothetical protein [Kiritimatiellia bacterium]
MGNVIVGAVIILLAGFAAWRHFGRKGQGGKSCPGCGCGCGCDCCG